MAPPGTDRRTLSPDCPREPPGLFSSSPSRPGSARNHRGFYRMIIIILILYFFFRGIRRKANQNETRVPVPAREVISRLRNDRAEGGGGARLAETNFPRFPFTRGAEPGRREAPGRPPLRRAPLPAKPPRSAALGPRFFVSFLKRPTLSLSFFCLGFFGFLHALGLRVCPVPPSSSPDPFSWDKAEQGAASPAVPGGCPQPSSGLSSPGEGPGWRHGRCSVPGPRSVQQGGGPQPPQPSAQEPDPLC